MKPPMTVKMKIFLWGLFLIKITLIAHLSIALLGPDWRFFTSKPAYSQEKKSETTAEKPKEKEKGKAETEKAAGKNKEKEEAGKSEQPIKETDGEQRVSAEKEKAEAFQDIKITLEGLEQKRLEIQDAERRLTEEKKRLEDVKQELANQIEALAKINQQLDDKLKAAESKETAAERDQKAAEEKKLKNLVKVYSGMKQKEVAAILDRLEMELVEKLFLRMKGDQAGQLLTYMNKERAAKISERLALENKKSK